MTWPDRSKPLSSIDLTPETAVSWLNRIVPLVGDRIRRDHIAGDVGLACGFVLTSWIVLMSSSSAPSLGVVSVTMTLPGPWTVITHLSPARSMPETTLPSLLKPWLLGLLGLIASVARKSSRS